MISFTGTQRGMTEAQQATLRDLLGWYYAAGARGFVHGDCIGADSQADELAREIGFARYLYPCTIWVKRAHCERRGAIVVAPPAPPLVRNEWIVCASGILFATPGEPSEIVRSGTWATVRRARKYRREILILHPDGGYRFDT